MNERVKMETVELKSLHDQSYTMKESLRILRTNLQFCGDDIHTILFTSAAPDEGKSTVVLNLARSLTDSKKGVLVIDADMRKSALIGRLGAKKEGGEIYGLSHFLTGQKRLADVIYATQVPRLYIVFAGPPVPNPTEILEKKYFEELLSFGREYFDYVLIDCPPVGAAIDAAVIAPKCDGAIFVVAQGQVSSRLISETKHQLEASGIRILGAVLNKVDMKRGGAYGKYYDKYYGKYYSKYYSDCDTEKTGKSVNTKKGS